MKNEEKVMMNKKLRREGKNEIGTEKRGAAERKKSGGGNSERGRPTSSTGGERSAATRRAKDGSDTY